MSEVVDFPGKRIFVCLCGCSTWELLEDGTTRCAACENVTLDGGSWFYERPEAQERSDPPFRDIQSNLSVDFSRRRMAALAADGDAALIVVAKEGGCVSAWSAADTKERFAWARRKMKVAVGLLREGEKKL